MLFQYTTDDVDTRAITRRLRQDGSLVGVLTTEESKTDEELLEMSRSWDIVGKRFSLLDGYGCEYYRTLAVLTLLIQFSGIDLISGVTCTAPYEWVDKTDPEWDFNCEGRGEIYHVSMTCLSLISVEYLCLQFALTLFHAYSWSEGHCI
jgi:carbamoyl-phosphate synthase small subunit